MGIVGSLVILRWAQTLIRDTSGILLDSAEQDTALDDIRERIERDTDARVTDLHLWQLAPGHNAASLCVETATPGAPEDYKALLRDMPQLSHIVIEVNINARGC